MTQQADSTLRAALNKVDRERRRATVMLFLLLGLTLFFWVAMMSKDDHHGLPLGLAAVMGTVYVAAMMAAKTSHENTRTILKAIELLSEQNRVN